MPENIKVCVGIPCNRQIKTKTVESIFGIVNKSPYDLILEIATQGYTISENRNWLAAQAIKNNCTHLFFVDDDMVFPPETLDKLLKHQKDIAGVAYHPRCEVDKDTHIPLDKTHIITLKDANSPKELFECEAVGTGVMLINTEVFKKTARPWFDTETHETGYTIKGEDWFFCFQAKKAGFTIWCDPTLEIKHIGDFLF